MYQTKSHYNVSPRTIGGLIETMFQNGWADPREQKAATVPANILETDAGYEIHLAAPGIPKEELKINIERNVLIISYDAKEETGTDGKWLRTEFRTQPFRRSFTLNDNIDQTAIGAAYNNGILVVSLPKKEEAVPAKKEITVN